MTSMEDGIDSRAVLSEVLSELTVGASNETTEGEIAAYTDIFFEARPVVDGVVQLVDAP